MLGIDIFENKSQRNWGVLKDNFNGFGHPDTVLANIMTVNRLITCFCREREVGGPGS